MLVGYMRVSSADDRQTVDLQRDALVAAGVDPRNLHTDKASGARDDRPGLKDCLDYLSAGDTLIVWKLDRLGRSLPHLLAIVTDLKARGIAFRSLTEQMDTNTPHGELLFSLFGALAQYERALTAAIWPQRIRSFIKPILSSNADPATAPERPVDRTARSHRAGDMLPEVPIERRTPGNELEAKPVVDHREAPRRERHALAIDAADMFAVRRGLMRETGSRGDGGLRCVEVALLQCVDETARHDELLALPPGEALAFEKCRARVHRIAHR